MAETHVRDIIGEVFRRGGMRKAVRRAQAVLMWPRIVGPELAAFTRARALTSGVLFVDVPDSETAMHLSMQRSRFLAAYDARFGSREVREIRFRAGRERASEEDRPPPPASEVEPAERAALLRGLDPERLPDGLAAPAMRAAEALLAHRARARAQGWTPCPHCGALSPEPGACDACRRHRSEPRVLRAADRLARSPDEPQPALTEDEAEVARALAIEALDARLQELLPQVLASPALVPQLEGAARNRLALAARVPPESVDDDDLARLDPAVARVLGRWR